MRNFAPLVFRAAKTAAIKDLAAKTIDGTVPSGRALLRMSDDEIIARLTQVRGIGRWTVEMLLLFDLGRPDVWPVADYGVQKGFAKTFRKTETAHAETADEARREMAAVSLRCGLVFLASAGSAWLRDKPLKRSRICHVERSETSLIFCLAARES